MLNQPTKNYSLMKEIRESFNMSIPLIVALLAQMGMGIVDTVMLGWVGPKELAAIALGTASYDIFVVTLIGIFNASAVMIARYYGARHNAAIRRIVQQLMFLVLLFVPLCFIYFKCIPLILTSMGQQSDLIVLVRAYLSTLVWGLPAWISFIALREFSVAIQRPRIVMLVCFLGMPINAFFNYLLIYGKWGFPALGVAGVGYATAAAYWLMFFVTLSYMLSQAGLAKYLFLRKFPRFHGKKMKQIFVLGWPISAMIFFEVGLFAISSLLMGYFGTIALAAHQIALKAVNVAFMIPLGIAQATAILVGRANGAKDPNAARRSVYIGIAVGVGLSTIAAVLFLFKPTFIIGLFLDLNTPKNQPVIQLAITFLFVGAVFQLIDAFQTIATGALRGYHDTLIPMIIGMVSFWAFGLAGGYILGFHLMENGGLGLWWGLALGIFVSTCLLFARLYRRIHYG